MVFGFNNFILEENKNVYGPIVFPSKSHWAVWVAKAAKARFHGFTTEEVQILDCWPLSML